MNTGSLCLKLPDKDTQPLCSQRKVVTTHSHLPSPIVVDFETSLHPGLVLHNGSWEVKFTSCCETVTWHICPVSLWVERKHCEIFPKLEPFQPGPRSVCADLQTAMATMTVHNDHMSWPYSANRPGTRLEPLQLIENCTSHFGNQPPCVTVNQWCFVLQQSLTTVWKAPPYSSLWCGVDLV